MWSKNQTIWSRFLVSARRGQEAATSNYPGSLAIAVGGETGRHSIESLFTESNGKEGQAGHRGSGDLGDDVWPPLWGHHLTLGLGRGHQACEVKRAGSRVEERNGSNDAGCRGSDVPAEGDRALHLDKAWKANKNHGELHA